MTRKWQDLSPQEKALYNNGVGPRWFAASLRRALTRFSERYFQEAGWAHHDYEYSIAAVPRAVADLRFLQAMLRDAARQEQARHVLASVCLSIIFWAVVRLFGAASYNRV